MYLSIWMISDWLSENSKEVRYKNGRKDIMSAKLYSKGSPCENNVVYIGRSADVLNDGGDAVVCKNRDDILVTDSTDIVKIFNMVQDAFSYYNKWYMDCESSLPHISVNELLDKTCEIFPTPVILVDSSQTFIGISSSTAEFQSTEEWKAAIENQGVSDDMLSTYNTEHPEAYQTTRLFQVDERYFFVNGYCRHLFIDGERRASLILKDPDYAYSKGRLDIFESYTDLVGKWIIMHSASDASLKTDSHFAGALFGNPDDVKAMTRQTMLFGWNKNARKLIFVLAPANENAAVDYQSVRRLTSEARGRYSTIYQGRIIVLFNAEINDMDPRTFDNDLKGHMIQKDLYGAVSFTFTDMKFIGEAYQTALNTLETSPKAPGVLYSCQKNYISRVCKILKEQTASTLLHPAVVFLMDYDEKNKTDYCNTLFVYLKNERRSQTTADELFIHRNTLFQRLQKIQDIYPLDLEDPLERFHLQLSFYCSHNI